MNSFLFDSNAIIYWLLDESEHNKALNRLIEATLEARGSIYALASSLNEIYYVLQRHYMPKDEAREALRDIVSNFDLVDLSGLIVLEAINSNEPDYEDGLIRATAEALETNAIISYDKKAFRNSYIPKMTAEQAIELI